MKSKRPVTHNLTTFRGRVRAWAHFYLKDHHLLRIWWWNLVEIAPGVWRSNQPSPRRLKRYKALGIRTVVSLRGSQAQSFNLLETAACAELGLKFRHVQGVPAQGLKPGKVVLRSIDALAKVPRPFVMHCKSGADRTGFLAAVFLIVVDGVDVALAARQLARKHIHFPRSRAGVLDHVFRVYLRDVAGGGQGFRDWLETGYNAKAIEADFKDWRNGAGRWA